MCYQVWQERADDYEAKSEADLRDQRGQRASSIFPGYERHSQPIVCSEQGPGWDELQQWVLQVDLPGQELSGGDQEGE